MVRWLPALFLLIAIGGLQSQPTETGYTPVAPAAALHAALQSNLKQYGDWVADKDFASAAVTARGVIALAHLYGYQSSDAGWKKRIAELTDSCGKLAASAGQKNAADCQKAIETCNRILAEFAKSPPAGAKAVEKSFKPPAATKTWMLLMDAAYGDAKFAKTPQQLEQLAHAIAEEVNATAYLKNDAAWRKQSLEVRAAALQVAKESGDLALAKKTLKEVYNRCEACHEKYQK
jgi:hypothetical protein